MTDKYSCRADEIENIINNTPDGGRCILSCEEYYLKRRVVIKNKNNITIDGNGSVFIAHYDNSQSYEHSVDPILIEECRGVTLKNLTFTTDSPTNISATVEEVIPESAALIIKVDDHFNISGNEVLMAFNSVDSEGSFDYALAYYSLHPDKSITTLIQGEILCFATYSGARNEYFGNNRFKVYFKDTQVLAGTHVGMRLCIRHTMYGPSNITIRNSDDTVLKDITMYSVPGFGVMALSRCENLTIDGLRMPLDTSRGSYMSCNCDGVHITGVTGKFVMKNCLFEGLGDDALNIHATAGTVTGVDSANRIIKCNYCKKSDDGLLPANWCREGDTIRFFDPVSLRVSATATVAGFSADRLELSNITGNISTGYMMQNIAFAPLCEINNCVVKNTRARGFLLQSENVIVTDCEFFGMSSSAVKAAPAFIKWYEVGPSHNLRIVNNKITKCAFISDRHSDIAVQTSHDGNDERIFGLHSDIYISENIFTRSSGTCIEISSADRVAVTNNTFVSRTYPIQQPIKTVACSDVSVVNNKDV